MMNWERFGFTRTESRVLLFLVGAFIAGSIIRWIQIRSAPPVLLQIQESPVVKDSVSYPTVVEVNKPPVGGININLATAADLEKIPGIGHVTAARIIEYRDKNGYFAAIDDLINVKGIGSKTIDKIRQYLIIN